MNTTCIHPFPVSLSSDLEKVTAAISCCDPLIRHTGRSLLSINHTWERAKERRAKMLNDMEVIVIFVCAHACRLWSWYAWPTTRWIQISAVRFHYLRAWRFGRMMRCWIFHFTAIIHYLSTAFLLCVQKSTTTAPCPSHCMKMTWLMQIGLKKWKMETQFSLTWLHILIYTIGFKNRKADILSQLWWFSRPKLTSHPSMTIVEFYKRNTVLNSSWTTY